MRAGSEPFGAAPCAFAADTKTTELTTKPADMAHAASSFITI
jgi:hypothetical protein